MDPKGVGRSPNGLVAPENLHEMTVRHHSIRFKCKGRKQRPLFRPPKLQVLAAPAQFERTQNGHVESALRAGRLAHHDPSTYSRRNRNVISR
jgi:hypothetical protein